LSLPEFFHDHWSELGGDHFIALCTALNIALLGWENFRKHISGTEVRMREKISSVRLTIADATEGNVVKILGDLILVPLFFLNRWGWRITYFFVILASLTGLFMLWAKKSCPFDFVLLLLPSACQVALGWITVGATLLWIAIVTRTMRRRSEISAFLDEKDPPTGGSLDDKEPPAGGASP
jgi:hypothetical protein